MSKWFKFSTKQKLAIKSWAHAAIGGLAGFLFQFLSNPGQHWTVKTFLYAAVGAIAAPVTRRIASMYSALAIKYPMLKPWANKILPAIKSKFAKKP